jgi:hypothetical protein
LTVIPVVTGVALACYGEMQFSFLGFWITVLCVVLAGELSSRTRLHDKTFTNKTMTRQPAFKEQKRQDKDKTTGQDRTGQDKT